MRIVSLVSAMILAAILSGCMSVPGMPGYINESTSSFDGTTELSMQPAFVYRNNNGMSGSSFKLGLFWRSDMPGDLLLLIAEVDGTHIFADGRSLEFNIDGRRTSLESVDSMNDIRYEPGAGQVRGDNVSSTRYAVDQEFIEDLLQAERATVRLNLRQTRMEGVFTDSTISSANVAFKSFMQKRAEMK